MNIFPIATSVVIGAVILSIILFPIFLPIVKYGYPLIKNYVGYLLIITAVFMILRDSERVRERVIEILETETEPLLDETMYKELRRICELADARHKDEELDFEMFG